MTAYMKKELTDDEIVRRMIAGFADAFTSGYTPCIEDFLYIFDEEDVWRNIGRYEKCYEEALGLVI
jgi:hypothetical protein